jgi:hypothetical protein
MVWLQHARHQFPGLVAYGVPERSRELKHTIEDQIKKLLLQAHNQIIIKMLPPKQGWQRFFNCRFKKSFCLIFNAFASLSGAN